jgi:hypothetical protein
VIISAFNIALEIFDMRINLFLKKKFVFITISVFSEGFNSKKIDLSINFNDLMIDFLLFLIILRV